MSNLWSRLKKWRDLKRYSLSKPVSLEEGASKLRYTTGVFVVIDFASNGSVLRERVLDIEQADNIGERLQDPELRAQWEKQAQGRIFVRAHTISSYSPAFDHYKAEHLLHRALLPRGDETTNGANAAD